MSRRLSISHRFVELMPDELEDGIVYVSMEYATAVHKCFCGCGNEVVTPISRTDWRLSFDGESISLSPSVGNWGFKCRSHYFIKDNRVQWAGAMSQEAVSAVRAHDRLAKGARYGNIQPLVAPKSQDGSAPPLGLGRRIAAWIGRVFN